MNRERLVQSIKKHEGYRSYPYQDSRGFWTIGWGHLIHHDALETYQHRRTLGGMLDYICSLETHIQWLESDIQTAERNARGYIGSTFDTLTPIRQEVLVEAAFQLGGRSLNGFRKLRGAILESAWVRAEAEMLNSRWAQQTPNRVKTLAARMLAG